MYVQQTDILHKNDSSTFSREGMARRQKYDLFVDKSSMKSPTFVDFKVYFCERNPITGPFLRNYCDITSYALVFNIWSVSENFLLWSRVPLAYVTQQVSSHSMSACQVLQSYALLRTARFDARCAACCVAVW